MNYFQNNLLTSTKKNYLEVIKIILWFFILPSLSCFSQRITEQMADAARQAFEENNYEEALSLYEQLISEKPKNVHYHYYAGLCLMNTNGDPEKAIYHFNCAHSGYTTAEIKTHLAKAYLLNYQPDMTISLLSHNPEGQQQSALLSNARILKEKTRSFIPQKCEYVTETSMDFLYDTLKSICKRLNKGPESITLMRLNKDNENDFVLYRQHSANPFIYFSSAGVQQDIMKIKKITDGRTTKADGLGHTINTPENEIFPYFDPYTTTLYFSSNGHSSCGGYDLFRSVLNPETGIWTTPENLGFPINTPYDDLIYLPVNPTYAILVSARNCSKTNVRIYILTATKNSRAYYASTNDELAQHAGFIIPGDIDDPGAGKDQKNTAYNTSAKLPSAAYKKNIQQGLFYQAIADSMLRLAEGKNKILFSLASSTQITAERKEIYRLKKYAGEIQLKADQYFIEASNNETTILSDANNPSGMKTTAKPSINKFNISSTPSANELLQPTPVILPDGIIYRIQLGVYSTAMPHSYFKGIQPLSGEKFLQPPVIKYYAGVFTSYFDCSAALEEVRALGFTDAFIVSYLNGKEIPAERAKKLEQ